MWLHTAHPLEREVERERQGLRVRPRPREVGRETGAVCVAHTAGRARGTREKGVVSRPREREREVDKGCVWRIRQSEGAVRDQRGNGVASGGGDGHDDRGVDSVSHALEGGGGRGRMELFHEEG